jgi:hypothetical protein
LFKKAAELLTGSNYKMFEISEMVGYTSKTNPGGIFETIWHVAKDYVNIKRNERATDITN